MRTLLLDIDSVLMGWTQHAPGCGFTDWHHHKDIEYWRWTSQDQLDLIMEVFSNTGDEPYWLTTWEPGFDGGANAAFSDSGLVEWPHLKRFNPDLLHRMFRSNLAVWWKMRVVQDLLASKHEALMGEVVWVDDELSGARRRQVKQMLTMENALDRFTLVNPIQVWTRESIESFRLPTDVSVPTTAESRTAGDASEVSP